MPRRDYYDVLGVNRNASEQDIKSAYRRIAVKYHPDRNPGNKEAEENFKQAAEAYSVLSVPDKRARYDRFGHAGVSTGAGGFGGFDPDIFADFSDILGDFFGFGNVFGGSQRGRRGRVQRGADLRYDLKISFEEAAFGTKTKIKIPRQEVCTACQGSGAESGSGRSTCSSCRGQGQVRYQQGFFTISRTCPQCQGAGQIIKKRCRACQGTGRLQKERILEVTIPAGVDEESSLRLAGEGEAGMSGGSSGDLYVVIYVEEHPFFKRQERNIYCEVPISFPRAALGGEITVPTLTGEERIRIPEGTQAGTVFRLKGRGVVSLDGYGKGDQLVTVSVVTPTNLTKEERQLFEHLAKIFQQETDDRSTLFEKVKDVFG